ncbi:MAG: cation transporter [Cytophagales bacterium]|nr:cation transporter [Cytophagales bacterium]
MTKNSTGNIKVAFFLNLCFTIIEIFGGIWTNSIAILSDALHDLGDSFSLGLAWYLERFSAKKASKNFTFGYRRFSLLGALINGLILVGGSLYILSKAIPRIINPEPSYAEGMFFFALGGIIVNGLAVLRLKGGKTLNERVITWHLLEDVLGWAAILIVSIVLMFKEIYILDPILSILITLYVLYNGLKYLKKTLFVFLQGTPEQINISEIENKIITIDDVQSVHHTQTWSLDGEQHVLTTHVVIKENISQKDIIMIKEKVKSLVSHLNIQHVTLEVEYENEKCELK